MRPLVRSCCALLAVLTFSLVLSASQTASAQTCTPPPSGMLAWYTGDGNADDIQNGNNGTLQNGATFAAGKVAQALSFDGTDDFVAAPDSSSLDITGDLTIDAWIRPTGSFAQGPVIVSKRDVDNSDVTYVLFLDGNGRLSFASRQNNGGFFILSTTVTIPQNQFSHVAVTVQGSTAKLYVNGQEQASSTVSPTRTASDGRLTIGVAETSGQGCGGACGFFPGLIDEVEIFTRALTQAEIQAIVNADSAGKCKTGTRAAGDVVISEFRWDGPDADATTRANNEFIELYNNTNSPITVSAPDNSGGWAVAADDATGTRFVIPSGTVIPARGHYLITNSNGYSLSGYPAGVGTTATPDGTYTTDIPTNTGIALFRTANTSNFSETTRLDAVGSAGGANQCFGTTVPQSSLLYREGMGLTVYPAFGDFEYSFLRKLTSGTPQDTANNAADFTYISTNGAYVICGNGTGGALGAPGPENTSSPVQRNATIKASLIDSMQPSFASPNRRRSGTIEGPETGNNTRGTLKIRRKFTNVTGAPVTRLRFRVVDITTTPRPNDSTAELRVLPNSAGGSLLLSDGTTSVTLTELTREEPPAQSSMGGGFNTTLSATLAQPLAEGASINVEFNLGVINDGPFRFLVNVEALLGTSTAASGNQSNLKGSAIKASGNRKQK